MKLERISASSATPSNSSSSPSSAASHPTLLLSVVIIGRNEGERLRRCIESVRGMRREGFELELLYVDSGSSDGSVAAAEELGARTISLQSAHPTAARGRNAGWRAARGSIVLFLDGDTLLHPDFVADSLVEFEAMETAAVWGHRREIRTEASVYNRALDLDWVHRPGQMVFCGGDALFRRDVLAEAGGYDENLIAGEEPELCRRVDALGYRILHVDRAMTGHDLAMARWSQYWKRAVRTGHAYAEVSERFRGSGQPFWEDEARHNRNRAWVLVGMTVMGWIAAAVWWSPWPLVAVISALLVLALRSAWKARWKSGNIVTLLVYGLHSHVQQLPIYRGQLQYKWNRRRGKRARLMEYKQP